MGKYRETVAWLTSKPSLSSSPWIRGAPHRFCSYAYDENGDLVAADTEPAYTCIIAGETSREMKLTIKVKNPGRTFHSYCVAVE